MRLKLPTMTVALALVSFTACGGSDSATSTSASHAATTSSTSGSNAGGGGSGTGGAGTGGAGGSVDKAAHCASTFGNALTAPFGRIDGTVLAIVKPTDTQCAQPNNDHVVLQVTMNGAAYRMVINVESTIGDPKVQYLKHDAPLPAPAWSEGWHTGVMLDYVATLGVHSTGFTPYSLDELSNVIADAIDLDQKVSVYAQTSGGSSAHEIHKNSGSGVDGAVVLDPTGANPHWLLFHFADQTF